MYYTLFPCVTIMDITVGTWKSCRKVAAASLALCSKRCMQHQSDIIWIVRTATGTWVECADLSSRHYNIYDAVSGAVLGVWVSQRMPNKSYATKINEVLVAVDTTARQLAICNDLNYFCRVLVQRGELNGDMRIYRDL